MKRGRGKPAMRWVDTDINPLSNKRGSKQDENPTNKGGNIKEKRALVKITSNVRFDEQYR